MHYRLALFCFLGLLATANAAAIYQWTDSAGVMHYSDQPRQGATIVQSSPLNQSHAINAGSKKQQSGASKNKKVASSAIAYTYLVITKPGSKATVHKHPLQVSVVIKPALQLTDHLTLFLDGVSVATTGLMQGDNANFSVKDVDRGEHNLMVELVNQKGTLLLKSPEVSFYQFQQSKKAVRLHA